MNYYDGVPFYNFPLLNVSDNIVNGLVIIIVVHLSGS